MVPLDVALQDLARSGVVHVRPRRILGRRSEVADHRVTCVLGTPGGILLGCGGVSGQNRIAETRVLERDLPVLDALLDIGAPLLGRRWIDVVDDRLDRIDELSTGVGSGIAWLEPPAGDKALCCRALLVQAVVDLRCAEKTHTLVAHTGLHGILGKQKHGVVHFHRERVARAVGRRVVGRIGEGAPHLDVGRERGGTGHESAVTVYGAHTVRLTSSLLQPYQGDVVGEQVAYVDDRGRTVVGHHLHIEGHDNRLEVGVVDRLGDRSRVVCKVLVVHQAKQNPLALPLPPNGRRVRLGAPNTHSRRRGRDTGEEQHLPLHHVQRDFEEEVVSNHMSVEDTLARDCFIRDHVAVRFGFLLFFIVLPIGLQHRHSS